MAVRVIGSGKAVTLPSKCQGTGEGSRLVGTSPLWGLTAIQPEKSEHKSIGNKGREINQTAASARCGGSALGWRVKPAPAAVGFAGSRCPLLAAFRSAGPLGSLWGFGARPARCKRASGRSHLARSRPIPEAARGGRCSGEARGARPTAAGVAPPAAALPTFWLPSSAQRERKRLRMRGLKVRIFTYTCRLSTFVYNSMLRIYRA